MTYKSSFSVDLSSVDLETLLGKSKDSYSITFNKDPLVVACCLRRLNGSFNNINDPDLYQFINDEDYSTAGKIRDYYAKKFFWLKLKSPDGLSPFRETAMQLLAESNNIVRADHIPIYVRLPWFYEEDTLYDKLKQQVNPITSKLECFDYVQVKLSLVGSSLRWNAKKLFENFWFVNSENYLHNIILEKNNPLLKIFKEEIKNNNLEFLTKLESRNVFDLSYYRLYDFKIIKE